jgi:hypothetical protein
MMKLLSNLFIQKKTRSNDYKYSLNYQVKKKLFLTLKNTYSTQKQPKS